MCNLWRKLKRMRTMNRRNSMANLYLSIPNQHESTNVWRDPPAFTRSRSCPAVIMTGIEDSRTAFDPASPSTHHCFPASQPSSPIRFPRRSKVSLNRFLASVWCHVNLFLYSLIRWATDDAQRQISSNHIILQIDTYKGPRLGPKESVPVSTSSLRRTSTVVPYP